jgi:hypothetical protein
LFAGASYPAFHEPPSFVVLGTEKRNTIMSTSTTLPPPQAWVPPLAEPLDEIKWQAWLAKGRAEENRSNDRCITVAKCLAIAALLAAAGLWSLLAPYVVGLRFVVTVSALLVMFQAVRARYYIASAAFGALVLLYNPVAPAIDFSSNWQRAIVVASAVPFAASLFWRAARNKHHV